MCTTPCYEDSLKVIMIISMIGGGISFLSTVIGAPIMIFAAHQDVNIMYLVFGFARAIDRGPFYSPEYYVAPYIPKGVALFTGGVLTFLIFDSIIFFCVNMIGHAGIKRRNKAMLCVFTIANYITCLVCICVILSIYLAASSEQPGLKQDFHDYAKDVNARRRVDLVQGQQFCCGSEEVDYIKNLRPLPASCCAIKPDETASRPSYESPHGYGGYGLGGGYGYGYGYGHGYGYEPGYGYGYDYRPTTKYEDYDDDLFRGLSANESYAFVICPPEEANRQRCATTLMDMYGSAISNIISTVFVVYMYILPSVRILWCFILGSLGAGLLHRYVKMDTEQVTE